MRANDLNDLENSRFIGPVTVCKFHVVHGIFECTCSTIISYHSNNIILNLLREHCHYLPLLATDYPFKYKYGTN